MIAALLEAAAGSAQADTAAGWVAVITALTAFVVTACSAVAGLVVTIRNGRKADVIGEKADAAKLAADEVKVTAQATAERVEAVHDCLHRQSAEVKAIVATVPGAAEVAAAQQSATGAPA